MTDYDFEQLLTNIHGEIRVGNLSWEAGYLIRKMDPVAFDEMKSAYEDSVESDEDDVDETDE